MILSCFPRAKNMKAIAPLIWGKAGRFTRLADSSPDYFFITIIMLKIIRPIVFAFLRGNAIKRLAIDILRAMVKKTDNTVDDGLVDLLERNLFPNS